MKEAWGGQPLVRTAVRDKPTAVHLGSRLAEMQGTGLVEVDYGSHRERRMT